MSNSSLISIVIPTYNSGKTIEACLESIRAQNFRDFEVLILDAVSTDDTLTIVNKFKDSIPLRIISEKDKGIYDAMNKGIALSNGKWLYFLGSDDAFFANDTLQQVSEVMKSTDAAVIYGNVMSDRFNGIYAGEFNKTKIYNQNICHQSIFFRKEIFQITGEFDLQYKAHADYDHNFKWFLSGKIRHSFMDIIVANYADGGFSSVTGDAKFAAMKRWKYSVLTSGAINKMTKLKILRDELRRALKQKRTADFFTIFFQSPKFLLNL